MTRFCRFASFALLVGATCLAGASPLDYKTDVLDPPPPAGQSSYPTFVILTTPFDFNFTTCAPYELPNGLSADGCFAGVNRTGSDWTGLQYTFPNQGAIYNQPVACDPATSDNIYSSFSCSLDPATGLYVISFSSGVIRDGDYFFIIEDGIVPAESFPQGHATVTTSTTPEPSSLILLGTGGLAVLSTWRSRARAAAATRR